MRLINADEFFEDFCELAPYEHISHEYDIDAVEVVRCKDCKYSKYKQVELRCCIWSITSKTKEDGYCYWGEKMEEDEISNIARESADKISKALEKVRAKGMQKQNIKEDEP